MIKREFNRHLEMMNHLTSMKIALHKMVSVHVHIKVNFKSAVQL